MSGGNFKNDPERASEAGKKGGQASGGNFANDREKASEAGRVGGQHSHGGGRKATTTANFPPIAGAVLPPRRC